MSETQEKEKSMVIRLDPIQFHNLLSAIDNLVKETSELKNIVNRLERLESAVVRVEGELKLIRVK